MNIFRHSLIAKSFEFAGKVYLLLRKNDINNKKLKKTHTILDSYDFLKEGIEREIL